MPKEPIKTDNIHKITPKIMNSFADVLMEVIKVGPGLGMGKFNNKIAIYLLHPRRGKRGPR